MVYYCIYNLSSMKTGNDDWLKLCGAWNDMEATAEELIKLN